MHMRTASVQRFVSFFPGDPIGGMVPILAFGGGLVPQRGAINSQRKRYSYPRATLVRFLGRLLRVRVGKLVRFLRIPYFRESLSSPRRLFLFLKQRSLAAQQFLRLPPNLNLLPKSLLLSFFPCRGSLPIHICTSERCLPSRRTLFSPSLVKVRLGRGGRK